jgi:hypothetical protein
VSACWWQSGEEGERELVARKRGCRYAWIDVVRGDRGERTWRAWTFVDYTTRAFATEEEAEHYVLESLGKVGDDLAAPLPRLYEETT